MIMPCRTLSSVTASSIDWVPLQTELEHASSPINDRVRTTVQGQFHATITQSLFTIYYQDYQIATARYRKYKSNSRISAR
ncbi:unnamed protein product [Nezara viridula]|uniref:Uncharacterized protein n=1 Tax=Nezara viridula TaxID=85310 RepID=A0A9P0DXL5_NEZVI|nr:unnamed protein product [Nezara viridula]